MLQPTITVLIYSRMIYIVKQIMNVVNVFHGLYYKRIINLLGFNDFEYLNIIEEPHGHLNTHKTCV